MKVCVTCDHELDNGERCHAEQYAPIQDRAGRHGGKCWDSSFPSSNDINDEQTRARRRQEARALLTTIAHVNEQLGLEL